MIGFIKGLFRPEADFPKLVQEGALVVDVRTGGEYATGHIEGSRNIPLDKIRTEVQSLK